METAPFYMRERAAPRSVDLSVAPLLFEISHNVAVSFRFRPPFVRKTVQHTWYAEGTGASCTKHRTKHACYGQK